MMLKESLHSCMGCLDLFLMRRTSMMPVPKVISEYSKKCDPDLPFYYYTGANDKYKDGSLQSFNIPSSSGVE